MREQPYDFDAHVDRTGTNSLKWQRYAGRDILPMWVADMDYAAPPCVHSALRDRVDHGVYGYTLASDELIQVLLDRFRELYSWEIKADWIVWLPGVVPGLHAACRAYSEPGDAIVTFTPVYPPLLGTPALAGRNLIAVDLVLRDGHYTIDMEAFEQALTPRTKVLLLCQPHNPVGRLFTREELEPVIALCRARGIVICSDEIHCDLLLDGQAHQPVPSLTAEAPGMSLTLMSPGKTFNTAGLNLAFAVIPDPALRRRYVNARKDIIPTPNALAYTACLAAYRDGEFWRQALLAVLRRNADIVCEAVSRGMAPLTTTRVDSTYLAWIDARGLEAKHPYTFFRNGGVGLSDGTPFGAPGFVRLNFACPLPMLEAALGRMTEAVGGRG